MFVDCSGIIISIIVKHERHIGIIKAFCLPKGLVKNRKNYWVVVC